MAVSFCQADISLSHQGKEVSVEGLSPLDEPVDTSTGIFLVYGWYEKGQLTVGCAILEQVALSGVRKQVEQATEAHKQHFFTVSASVLAFRFCMMMDCNPYAK